MRCAGTLLIVKERTLVGELMDNPGLDARKHERALAGLARLNRLSGAARPITRAITQLTSQPRITLVDVATGSGDVLLGVVRRLERAGIRVEAHAVDISEPALEAASDRCRKAGVTIHTHAADLIRDGLPGEFDVAMCSLFLHHLTDGDAVSLLSRLRERCSAVVVSDLDRSRPGLAAAAIAPRLVTRSPVVHTDALRSVRAAFTPGEAAAIAERAGMRSATVQTIWPYRWLMTWRAP